MKRPDAATYWLVGPLIMVLLPHFSFLPSWVDAAALVALLWRLSPAWDKDSPAQKWLRMLLIVVAIAGVLLEHHTLFGPRGGVSFLVLMTMLKLLESSGRRDQLVMVLAGYFMLLSVLIHDQRLPVAAWLLLCAVVLTASLPATQGSAPLPPRRALKLAAGMILQGLPLALLLFVLFPRLHAPIGGLIQGDQARTGLSDTMQPGSISQLLQSDAIAFRADFGSAAVDGKTLYWRGPVLTDFDGRTWRRGISEPIPPAATHDGSPVTYTVTLEPGPLAGLPVAGLASRISLPGAHGNSDGEWLAPKPISQRQHYSVSAWLNYALEPALPPERKADALALPDGYNPETHQLGQRLRQQYRTPAATIEAALAYFRQQPFYYTLSPPALGDDAVDDFMFGTRRGFCEHYAGAFAVLMRAAGIPTRIVTGYQGGELNPLGHYWIVRQRDAHAWDEVWLEGRGWQRVDPTAAIAPERVEADTRVAILDDTPVALDLPSSWLHPLRQTWDYLNNSWNQWVIGYDYERQHRILSTLSPSLGSLRGMLWAMLAGGALLVGGLSLYLLRPFRKRHGDEASRLYARFAKKLNRIGLRRNPSEGAHSFALRAILLRPRLKPEIEEIADLYTEVRYGRESVMALEKLRRAVASFRAN